MGNLPGAGDFNSIGSIARAESDTLVSDSDLSLGCANL